VYVVDEVAERFTRKVVERVAALRQGVAGEFDVGAIFWGRQLEIIEAQVEDAIAKGAKVLAGGRRNPDLAGLFYEPTVLIDVNHDMALMRDETFGPVLPIMRVADEEEGIRRANDSRYGLGAMVWTQDKQRGFELAQRMDAGSVSINDMSMTYGALEAPFGGRKESGIGQVNGPLGLRGYCYATPILSGRAGTGQYPYSLKADESMRRFMKLLFGSPLGRWFS
jgi:succinate-semialdehyde dehydrogenase/glutarate-semialdehyde dehydrogenase